MNLSQKPQISTGVEQFVELIGREELAGLLGVEELMELIKLIGLEELEGKKNRSVTTNGTRVE